MDVNDVIRRKRARRILGILKKSIELRTRLRTGSVDFQSSLSPDEFVRYGFHTCWGRRWECQYRKIVSLSLCRKTFKLKGNKKFRTWTKKSEVFFVFRDSHVLRIYVTNILCTFRISVSGSGTFMCCVFLTATTFLMMVPSFRIIFFRKASLMNDDNSISSQHDKLIVCNHCMPQIDVFQTRKTADKSWAKE